MAEPGIVLVIDDEAEVRQVIVRMLHGVGIDVVDAANGQDAVALLDGGLRPAVIVLDLWMPIMDGWAFRKAQVQAHPGIPIVVLSALDLSHERLVELRADALVGKPFDLEQLYGAVAKAVSGGS